MKYLLIFLFPILASCASNDDALSVKNTKNPNFQVAFLFEHEGCKVYRFYDGRDRYFTNCTETISSYTTSCGKNCYNTQDETVRNGKSK